MDLGLARPVAEREWSQLLAPSFAVSSSFATFSSPLLCSSPKPPLGCLGAAPVHRFKLCQPQNIARTSLTPAWGQRGGQRDWCRTNPVSKGKMLPSLLPLHAFTEGPFAHRAVMGVCVECPSVGTGRWGIPSCSLRTPVNIDAELCWGISCPSAWVPPCDMLCQMHCIRAAVRHYDGVPPAPEAKPERADDGATLAPLPALPCSEQPQMRPRPRLQTQGLFAN